jgi:cytochrome c-type biogenesis protein CcmH
LTIFILACAGLVLLSGLFYLFPGQRPGGADADLQQANLEWYRLRQAELERDGNDDDLREDAQLRLLEDEQSGQPGQAPEAVAGRPFRAWWLLPVIAVASSALYYQLGAAPDVMISKQLQALDTDSTPQTMRALMGAIEERAAQRPHNLEYTALLGRFYMGQQDYSSAARTYGTLAEEVPEDAQALAYAAQAEYLASGRQLSDLARLRAEQALAINPHQRTALGLLGMASFEQQQYRAAIGYWERLLVSEPPGSEGANMINGVIATARQRLGEDPGPGEPEPAAVAATAAVSGAGVTVRVSLPDGAGVSPGDTVFVLARSADSDSRMPIAVQRLQAGQLPLTLRLDDSNSMAGQTLSSTASVMVFVQVSPDGRPGEANASWLGQVGPLTPSADGEPFEIQLQPNS